MKRFLTLLLLCSAMPVYADAYISIPSEIGTMQGHDMKSVEDQYFRFREINDMKEVSEEKEKFEKNTIENAKPPIVQKMINNTNSQFVEEDGKIKIKYSSY